MKVRLATLFAFLFVWAAMASADTLELKNGSVIKGTYLGGTEREINFRVGSRVQHFAVDDVSSVTFDMPVSETAPDTMLVLVRWCSRFGRPRLTTPRQLR